MFNSHSPDKVTVAEGSLEELFLLAQCACGGESGATVQVPAEVSEQIILEEWAERNCILLAQKEFDLFLCEGSFTSAEGGDEHDVFTGSDQVAIVKVTKTTSGYGARSLLLNYLENLVFSNIIFGDDIHLLAVIDDGDPGKVLKIAIAQPFIKGRPASQEEITVYMEGMSFHRIGEHSYKHPCGTTVHDARPANVFVSEDGWVFPIDVQILRGEKYVYYMLCSYINLLAKQASRKAMSTAFPH